MNRRVEGWTRHKILGAGVLIGLLAMLVSGVKPAGAVPEEGPIVFESDRGGHSDIWVMEADGSNAVNLTNDGIADVFPAWSSDGKKIAWTRGGRGPEGEIWVMDADGSGKTQITFNAFSDYNATWSPDGSRIAFRSFRGGNRDIYVMNSDGSGEQRLTDDPASDFGPDWSPDGTRIAWTSIRNGHSAIYTMTADGGDVRKLTPDEMAAALPGWSPDGNRIVFADGFCDTCGESDVFVMNADGTGIMQITDSPENELGKSWSRDGARVVVDFSTLTPSGRHLSKGDIAIIDVASGATLNLTASLGTSDEHPDWSPTKSRATEAAISLEDRRTVAASGLGASGGLKAGVLANPGRKFATVAYALPRAGNVQLRIFDVAGREVACLVNGWQAAGPHSASFSGGPRSQVYFYRLEWESHRASGKLSVVH